MKIKLTGLILFAQAVFLLSSCNSMIGLGASRGEGNLKLVDGEKKQTGTGIYLEYRWKKMIVSDTWNSIMTRSGLGIDYNVKVRTNTSKIHDESPGILFHSLKANTIIL